MGLERIGDWARVARIIRNLSRIIESARNVWLIRMAAKGEAIAVGHISAQDLNWKRLKASTVRAKVKKGQSEDIYVATSTYFQSITSWVAGDKAYIGVKRGVTNPDGQQVGNIAKWMEYGTSTMPARPLWQPTFKELMAWQWQHNDFRQIVLEKLRTA
jgi:hypothetical protein